MENCSVRDAAVRLNDWFGAGITPACQQPAPAGVDVPREGVESGGRNPPLKFALTGVDHCHPYLAARGILPETAQHFGVGLFPRKGMMEGRRYPNPR